MNDRPLPKLTDQEIAELIRCARLLATRFPMNEPTFASPQAPNLIVATHWHVTTPDQDRRIAAYWREHNLPDMCLICDRAGPFANFLIEEHRGGTFWVALHRACAHCGTRIALDAARVGLVTSSATPLAHRR